MADPLGAVIAGAGDLAGGIVNAISAAHSYKRRYQDTVADLKKAGLNPALAYGQNPGAGAQTAQLPNDLGSAAVRGANSAAQTRLINAQADFYSASAADRLNNIRQQGRLLAYQGDTEAMRPGLLGAQTALATREGFLRDAQTGLTLAQTKTEEQRPAEILARIATLAADRGLTQANTTRILQDNAFQRETWDTRKDQIWADLNSTNVDIRKKTAEAVLLVLSQPQAQAEAKANSTWFGQNVSPWLRQALQVLGIAAATVTGAAGVKNILEPSRKPISGFRP